MPTAILENRLEVMMYRRYLRRVYKSNLVFKESTFDNEVIYIIPFPTNLDW